MTIKENKTKIVQKLFFNIVFVIILSNLVGAITNFTDGICASRLVSDNASAALAIVSPLITFTVIFTSIIEIGTQILCSRRLAQGDTKGVKKIFSTSIILCIAVGLILMLVTLTANRPILKILGATDSNVLNEAIEYVKGFFIGVPFFILFTVLLPVSNLTSGKLLSSASILSVLIVNVVGDVISCLFFKRAVFGIGIATSLSFVVGTIVLSIAFIRKKSTIKFSFKNISFRAMGEITSLGLPAGAKIVFIFLRTSIVNIIFANNGYVNPNILFTALSATSHITPFVEAITGGLIATSLSLSSIFYAEEDEESLNELLKLIFKITGTVIIAITVAYALCADILTKLYGIGGTSGPETATIMIKQSKMALIWDAITIPFVAINASFLAIFQGTKRTKYAYLTTFLQSLVLPLLMLAVFIFASSYEGRAWVGLSFGFIAYTFLHLIYAFIYAKSHKRNFRFDIRTLFFLPKEFGYKEDQYIKILVRGIIDVGVIVEQIVDFCKKQNIDKKRTYNLASCAEELARSIVISGFTSDKKRKHICEIRVLYKSDDLILRIRDDCSNFNIEERAIRLEREKDPFANVAVKIINHSAKEIKYSNLLKTNNLIIRV